MITRLFLKKYRVKFRFYTLLIAGLVLVFAGCNMAKHVPESQYLLDDYEIELESKAKNVDKSELESYVKQKPNQKVLGVKLYLLVYNLIDPEKEEAREKQRLRRLSWMNAHKQKMNELIDARQKRQREAKGKKWNENVFIGITPWLITTLNLNKKKTETVGLSKWVQGLGEKPVLYDPLATGKTTEQFEQYLKNKGYYYAKVQDTTLRDEEKRSIEVRYSVAPGVAYKMGNISYGIIQNERLTEVFDTTATLLSQGQFFDVDILQNERLRIADSLRNNGYYFFNQEYVFFRVDSALQSHRVNIQVGIKQKQQQQDDSTIIATEHQPYYINKIFIYPDYDHKTALRDQQAYFDQLNMENFSKLDMDGNYIFMYENEPIIKRPVIARAIQFADGDLYRTSDIKSTYRYLASLGVFKLTNITFQTVSGAKNQTNHPHALDCHIQLTPTTTQSYGVELEGTHQSGNIGAAANFTYRHGNLLRGAEVFNFKFSFGRERQSSVVKSENNTNSFNANEVSTEATLEVPKLMIPFIRLNQLERNAPKTSIDFSFNYQQRPDYTRSIFNASYGYYWKSNEYITHIINPFEFYSTRVFQIDSAFQDYLVQVNLLDSYYDHLISAINYQLVFNNQKINKSTNFSYFKMNVETAGNIPTLYKRAVNAEVDTTYNVHTFLSTPYFQYINFDADYRYHFFLSQSSSIATRIFGGITYAYGNNQTTPFEKQYFSGGGNSLRAWQARSVGPGSYDFYASQNGNAPTSWINQRADLKLEANIEYRFKITGIFHGAFFIDAGNIWSLNESDSREGALFNWNDFYREIAVGTGAGLRIDLSFFVFRLDFGIQVYSPRFFGSPWRDDNKQAKTAFNFGIGYPF